MAFIKANIAFITRPKSTHVHDNFIKWTWGCLKCQFMPNAIEQIYLKVIHKAQNNAQKD